MQNSKIDENMAFITSKPFIIILVTFMISIITLNLFLLVLLLNTYSIDFKHLAIGLSIFLISIASIFLIKVEFIISIKNEYKHRPPLLAIFVFIASYLLLFWVLPNSFMEQPKSSPVILTILAIPALTLAVLLHGFYYHISVKLLKIFTGFKTKKILTEPDFLEKINFKANETNRYGGTFSLIMITFTVPRFAINKLKQAMVFSLFYDLIGKCIRNTDYLGSCGNGNIAVILSNNNTLEKAEVQARRIIDNLQKNSVFMKKIKVYNAELTTALSEYNPDLKKGNHLFEQTIKKIKDGQMQYWDRLSKSM